MTIRAAFVQSDCNRDYTPAAALDGGSVVLLGSGLIGITLTAIAAGVLGSVATEGLFDFNSASATVFTSGEDVFWDATNFLAVPAGDANATYRVGRATAAKVSGATTVRVLLNSNEGSLNLTAVADSAAVSNTTTETVVGTFSIPAGALIQARIIDFMAALVATATNSTDTFRFRVRLGGVAGTVVGDTTAIDLANNDAGVIMGQVVIREDGAAGTFVAGSQSILKTTANPIVVQSTAIDTTTAKTLVVTIEESVASASNSAKLVAFNAIIR